MGIVAAELALPLLTAWANQGLQLQHIDVVAASNAANVTADVAPQGGAATAHERFAATTHRCSCRACSALACRMGKVNFAATAHEWKGMYILEVTSEDKGKRIDNVSLKHLVGIRPALEISRVLIQGMIDSGEILFNGKKVKASHKVNQGDKIEIDLEKLEKESLENHDKKIPKAEKLPLDIIYEDGEILVINKPAGMVVHPACGNYSGTLVNALLNYKGFLTEFNEPRTTPHTKIVDFVRGTNDDQRESRAKSRHERRILRPGIVHRLDRDTSGVMLVAKTGVALRKLSSQLKNRAIAKKYIAVVKGIVDLEEGIIDLPVNHDKKNRMKMAVDRENGKEAVTHYKVISRNKEKNFTVLEVTPKTGRTHQIRIHLAAIGHPILGDALYNGPIVQGLSRQALHAKSISFIHPSKNQEVEFSAQIPKDIKQFFA